MANIPTDEELIAALTDAGWLLEQTVSHVLADFDCHPRLGWAFQDEDEPTKSRELDVFGYRQVLRDEQAKVIVSATFLVECKQSAMPYVAIGQTLPDWQFDQPAQHRIPTRKVQIRVQGSDAIREVDAWTRLGFAQIAADHGEDYFRATQLTRLDRNNKGWNATNSGIFTSLVFPLAKALRARQKDYHGGAGGSRIVIDGEPKPRESWLMFSLMFPVVVTSAELFIADTTSRVPVVSRAAWTTARRHLETKSLSGVFDFDVVREAKFADYIADRLAFAEAIATAVHADPETLAGMNWEVPSDEEEKEE